MMVFFTLYLMTIIVSSARSCMKYETISEELKSLVGNQDNCFHHNADRKKSKYNLKFQAIKMPSINNPLFPCQCRGFSRANLGKLLRSRELRNVHGFVRDDRAIRLRNPFSVKGHRFRARCNRPVDRKR